VVRGTSTPEATVIEKRERQVLEAISAMFAEGKWYASMMDLSHGVFVDGSAAKRWRQPYLATLVLDINTAPPGILRLTPGIGEAEVAGWMERRPFASVEDFRGRSGVKAATLAGMKF
jgi:hypothetical protein